MPEKQYLMDELLVGVGLTEDGWTTVARTALLALANPGAEDFSLVLRTTTLGPLNLLIEDGTSRRKVTFDAASSRDVRLGPLAPGASELYVISTDRVFGRPGNPRRRVGVRLQVLGRDAQP
jgi:hypothetical protein